MAKPSVGLRAPRPASRLTASSPLLHASSSSKVVAKCLAYEGSVTPSSSSSSSTASSLTVAGGFPREGLDAAEFDVMPLLELPDPVVAGENNSSAYAISDVTEDGAPADSTGMEMEVAAVDDLALVDHLQSVLAELEGAGGVSDRGKHLLRALAEAAVAELAGSKVAAAAARDAFWAKVRVGMLAAVVVAVAAIDVVLAAAVVGGRGATYGLPPT